MSVGPPTSDHEVPGEPPGPSEPRSREWLFWLLLAGVCSGAGAMLYAGGLAREIALAGAETLPLAILAALAYAGDRHGWPKLFALAAWGVVATALGLVAVAFTLIGRLDAEATRLVLVDDEAFARLWKTGPWHLLTPGGMASFRQAIFAAIGLFGLASLAYLAPVRRAAARILPIDPRSFVHATALAVVVLMTLTSVLPLLLLGSPPLLNLGALLPPEQTDDLANWAKQLPMMLVSLVWLIPAALMAVGWPIERSWSAACERLGVVWPTARQWGLGLAAGLVLVPISWGLDVGIATLWKWLGWPTTDAAAFESLIGFGRSSILGAVVVGMYAGISEEIVFRGVLQPRLGLLLANLAFTLVHAGQYHFDGLVGVFLLGLVLGQIRQMSNTTTSALAHGLLDVILLLTTPIAGQS